MQNLEIRALRARLQQFFLNNGHWHGAEIYLLVALLVFGLGACFLLPISGGYDEETHLVRAWQMSAYEFLPNDELDGKMPFPAIYWELSYRRQVLVRSVEPDLWTKYGRLAIDAHDYIYDSVETRSVYPPPLLLPQAAVLRWLGRSGRLPALPVYYACRIVGLLSYMLLAWLAVRLIPFGKWVLAILASSPVMILQASTISADAISNGIAFLFIGGTLAVAYHKDLQWKQWTSLAILVFVLFWGKINIIPLVLLPFLIIRPSQFKMRHGYILLLALTITLFLLEVVGWNVLAYSKLHTPPDGTDPTGQIKFILTHPLEFASILGGDIMTKGFKYLQNWIAIYGFNYWPVPSWTYYLYVAGLISALLIKVEEIEKRMRLALLTVFVISYLSTITLMYLTFNPVGHATIEGVQGRYFATVMPLLCLALAGLLFQKPIRIPSLFPAIFGGLSISLYMLGMYLSYHVPCGSQYYQTGLCYQPNYKNWAPEALYSAPINDQLILSQEIVPECNGVSEVRVWVDATGADPKGITEFVLKDVYLGQTITSIDMGNSELPHGDWYSLRFQPDWESNGKFYLLTILGNTHSSSGPRAAYSLRPEYPAGKLFENDQPLDKDLIFQTGCLVGLEKLLQSRSPK
jgi:uncharacterized membrane protein